MKTVVFNQKNYKKNISSCLDFLLTGEVIAFPTETVYGIGCDLFNESAVKKIYRLKSRESKKPLTAHISDLSHVDKLSDNIPDEFYSLAERFLPGPLTIIVKKKISVPDIVTAGKDTIGIRYPKNKIALDLIASFGKPLAATSANISGQSPAIEIDELIDNFKNKIPLIIDGGPTLYRIASTVISIVDNDFFLIREGAVSKSEIEKIIKVSLITK